MLCDSEQMGSSTQWTQRMMMIPPTNSNSQSNTTAAKRSSSSMTQQPQQQREPQQLKCPRCDSSNTKFCYYNNYSLSQPRHFCKACKRYWTRGGTLRNVPVGGGCRKNKRIKKHQQTPQPSSAAATATVSAATGTVAIPAPRSSSSIVNNLATTIDLSSFLYGDHVNLGGGYEALGLGGLIPHSDQLSTVFVNNNSSNLQPCFLNNDYPVSFGSQAASLLVSSMKQPRKVEDQYAQPSLPYEGLQQGYESLNLGFVKDVKIEDSNNLNNIGNNSASDQWQANYPFEALTGASDSSYLYWSSAMGGSVWPDPSSSSVAPLI